MWCNWKFVWRPTAVSLPFCLSLNGMLLLMLCQWMPRKNKKHSFSREKFTLEASLLHSLHVLSLNCLYGAQQVVLFFGSRISSRSSSRKRKQFIRGFLFPDTRGVREDVVKRGGCKLVWNTLFQASNLISIECIHFICENLLRPFCSTTSSLLADKFVHQHWMLTWFVRTFSLPFYLMKCFPQFFACRCLYWCCRPHRYSDAPWEQEKGEQTHASNHVPAKSDRHTQRATKSRLDDDLPSPAFDFCMNLFAYPLLLSVESAVADDGVES